MSVKLNGIDLNSVGDSIEAKYEAGIDDHSIHVARVLEEGNGNSNIRGSVKVDLNEEMGEVDKEQSLKAEIASVNMESDQVKEKKFENKGEVVGDGTERCNGNLGWELKRICNGEVEAIVDRDWNQGMGDNLIPLDLNASDRSHGNIVFDNVDNGTGGHEYLIELNLPVSDGVVESRAPVTKANQNGNRNLIVKGEIINGLREDLDGKDVKYGALMPKLRSKENQMEKEGEYYVSDLVWGKVRSHPWWPGQVFEPSAASEKAMKHFKKDTYLIAYFGDQTFAWNDASKIKPFRMYFSQMEKQSNSETFTRAVDDALNEVSRRVESGLACRCLQEEVLATVNSQVVVSAGIRMQSSRTSSKYSFTKACYFFPRTLVNYLESLAITPNTAIDRLDFVTARSQFLAFNRWNGYLQLPAFEDFDGISENEADPSGFQANGTLQDVSRKRKHMTADYQCKKQKKHIMELVRESSSSSPNGENNYEGKASRKLPSGSTGPKRKAVDVMSNESGLKIRKENSFPRAKTKASSLPRKNIKVGEHICRVAGRLGVVEHAGNSINGRASGVSTISSRNSLSGRLSLQELPTIDEMLSILAIAAKNTVEGYSSLVSVSGFFSDFRNLKYMGYNDLENKKKSSGKQTEEQSSALESIEALKFEGMEDSYWTDRIIESTLDEPVIFEPETDAQKDDSLVADPENVNGLNPNTVNDHETNTMVADLDKENPSNIIDEKSSEYTPTALILNFSDLKSVPSIPNLNEIFNRYGPLNESETEVLSKSKRAKVVFKRHSDAETAFSSTGKFSIFGPSLVSYRLKYSPTTRNASTASKTKGGRKKSTSAEAGAA